MDLIFDHTTKLYGPVIGVNDITCRVGSGLVGLIGANGAGKSTLLKLASGQLRPSQGEVRLGEHSAWSSAAKRSMGYSPDLNTFYKDMTGRRFVDQMTRLYGFTARESRERTSAVLEQVGMTAWADRRIGGYSHGMRQRIKLAQALVHDPMILLLDEPFSGIDPGGRREMHDLLVRLAGAGKTILVSSHILHEVEELAETILMVARGRLIAAGTIRDIRSQIVDQPLTLEIGARPLRRAASLLAEMPEVHSVEIRHDLIKVRTQNPGAFFTRVASLVLERDIEVYAMRTLDAGADAVFDYLQRWPA
jgi:ABC-2 type transport system ATP-binding protein